MHMVLRVAQVSLLVASLFLFGCGGGNSSNTTHLFPKQLGKPGAVTTGYSVIADNFGNIYVTGSTTGGLDGNTLAGSTDYFLTKYSALGAKIFTKQSGASGRDTHAIAIAKDSAGNVYVAGDTSGTLDGNALTGTVDAFFTKYDAAGIKQYTKMWGVATAITAGTSITVDVGGNVYVGGYTNGGLDGNTPTGTTDFFVTKFGPDGKKLYTKQLGVANSDTMTLALATDAKGNLYLAGVTSGGLDGNALTGTTDFFLTKYDSVGTRLYTKQLGAAGADSQGNSIAIDAGGNVYIAGETSGGLDGNTATGPTEYFLMKYDSAGTRLFTKQVGSAGASIYGFGVALEGESNVYLTGSTTAGLDGNALTGTRDLFLAKYDASGNMLYTKLLGASGALTSGYGIAMDPKNNIYVTGATTGGVDGNKLQGTSDAIVVKWDTNGNRL